MATPNWYYLDPDVFDGEIYGIGIRWSDSAKQRLNNDAREAAATPAKLKAVTEHFTYLCAFRLQRAKALIMASPHEFSTNSGAGGAQREDQNHISCRLSGTLDPNANVTGREKVHVYLTSEGVGPDKVDSLQMAGERVMKEKKNGKEVLDETRSTGNYPPLTEMSAQGSQSSYSYAGPSSSSGYTPTTSYSPATGYTTTTSYTPATMTSYLASTVSSSAMEGTTEWQWSSEYGQYYRYANGHIEWEKK